MKIYIYKYMKWKYKYKYRKLKIFDDIRIYVIFILKKIVLCIK